MTPQDHINAEPVEAVGVYITARAEGWDMVGIISAIRTLGRLLRRIGPEAVRAAEMAVFKAHGYRGESVLEAYWH